MPDEKPPPDPTELQHGLVQTLTSATTNAALLPRELFAPGHEFTSEMSAALKLTSVAAQVYLGLETASNASTEESRALGVRIARDALRALDHDPMLRHLVHECPGEPEEART
ncbi:hypothetical protein [Streptomyces sp. NBC_00470]|uniref:hypothetical protein n=1 Tax=Streptomyces sp. NBC_00470 TaxID=2975753 RepID=UPI0030E49A21